MKVCLGLVCSALCWAALPAVASGQTVTFFPTGGQQTFAVPAGVSSLHVVAVGASGGAAGSNPAPGGFGATASADLAVSGGLVLYVEVGGNGGSGSGSGAGGFNGGGAGGGAAGGGGGDSDVRTSPATAQVSLASRLVIAGGGGGGAQGSGGGNAGANGGAAGPGDAAPGQAATSTGNGAGGPATAPGTSPGSPGAFGIGGAGASGIDSGAGGGAGIFGGGGGAGCTNSMYCDAFSLGGNGGGGSSGFAMGASNTSIGTDTSGVGSVTIAYTGPPPSSPPPAPPSTKVIGSSLLAQLVPHGKAARIPAIRKHRGYTALFDALVQGTVTISWDETQHVRKHGHTVAKTVLIATGSHKFSAAGKGKLTIRLTGKGRTVFKHAKRLKLTAKGTFKPSGAAAIARQKAFTLHG
jgi:Glycine rich protein